MPHGSATAYDEESSLMHSKKTELEQSNEFTETQSEESTGKPSYELNRKNLAIITASVVRIISIVVFSILALNIKNTKFRVRSVMVEIHNYESSPNPSLNMTFTAEMNVKNPNLSYFSYGITNITFAYRGKQLGLVFVPKGKRGLTTRKLIAAKHLNSNNGRNDANLGSDMRSGFLTLTSHSKMNGKVYLMSLGKQRKANGRRRSAEMNCTLQLIWQKHLFRI